MKGRGLRNVTSHQTCHIKLSNFKNFTQLNKFHLFNSNCYHILTTLIVIIAFLIFLDCVPFALTVNFEILEVRQSKERIFNREPSTHNSFTSRCDVTNGCNRKWRKWTKCILDRRRRAGSEWNIHFIIGWRDPSSPYLFHEGAVCFVVGECWITKFGLFCVIFIF